MFTKRSMIFLLFFMFTASFWSCKSPASPDNQEKETQGFATVGVWSEPWHAFIWLDGLDTGERTNAELQVTTGTHTILILKPSYKDWKKTFSVNVDDYYIIDAKLTPITITVTNPTSDTIWIKGKESVITWEPSHTPPSSVSTDNDLNNLNSKSYGISTLESKNLIDTNQTSYDKKDLSKSSEINSRSNSIKSLNKMKVLYLPRVKIYLFKGDVEVKTIVSDIENNGSYTWIVDPSLEDGTDYKVRVNSPWETPAIIIVYGESEQFTIK